MAGTPTTAELTTRDVLVQIDRRLSLIEGDLRAMDAKLDHRSDGLRSDINGRFYWTVGTMVALVGLVVAVIKL